jgi:hypothetical protein
MCATPHGPVLLIGMVTPLRWTVPCRTFPKQCASLLPVCGRSLAGTFIDGLPSLIGDDSTIDMRSKLQLRRVVCSHSLVPIAA